MSKRKKITNSYKLNSLGLLVSFIFTVFFAIVMYKFITNDELSIISDQVWCANCQTYHDKATAEQEQNKLVWCINCNKYHEPRDESK